MRIRILEGSPAELQEFLALESSPPAEQSAPSVVRVRGAGVTDAPEEATKDDDAKVPMSPAIALRVISRDPALPDTMRGILKALHAVHPKCVSKAALAKKIDQDGSQVNGVLGAFGRRCASTHGTKKGELYFFRYEGEAGNWSYGLTEESYAAVTDFLKKSH